MQLGTRWNVGGEPPARLSDDMRAAIAAIESELVESGGMRWTLTWLEGRPVAELDDGTVVNQSAAGVVTVSP